MSGSDAEFCNPTPHPISTNVAVPCPTCGRCPTCGNQPFAWNPTLYWPLNQSPVWCGTTITSNASAVQ
jgi:hypothetical protein